MTDLLDLIVIGAGASGLMATKIASQRNKSVAIIDHLNLPAMKVMISGGGKCNFSNRSIRPDHYTSENTLFCRPTLAAFSTDDLIKMINQANIQWEERSGGKLFADSAEEIRKWLFAGIENPFVSKYFGTIVENVTKTDDGFCVQTNAETLYSQRVLVASGGLSYPATGATDLGMRLARNFGLRVVPPKPALVPLRFDDKSCLDLTDLSGISVLVTATIKKKKITDQLLLTHKGISGPAGLSASVFWQEGSPLKIDFLPELKAFEWLKDLRDKKDKRKLVTLLSLKLPQRLAKKFADLIPLDKAELPISQMSDKNIRIVSEALNTYSFVPSATDGYTKAEVTKGGVDTKELIPTTLEARQVKGLYFAGEVIDVTGQLGGYNLHWAFASGVKVGSSIP